jgi:nitrogen-specific signal transduction histidine kinase
VPVRVDEKFWGYIGFDNCTDNRVFSQEEISILRSASLLLSSAFHRNQTSIKLVETTQKLSASVKKLRKAEERLQLIFDVMPMSCMLVNKNLDVISCNAESVKMFNLPEEALEEKEKYYDMMQTFSPKYQPCGKPSASLRAEYIKKAFVSGYIRFFWQHETSNGEPLPCEVTLIRLNHKDEYIVVAYVRDLREQNAAIEARQRAEIAEQSSKAKSDFVAHMSHEIRTPMNSIIGFAELALESDALPQVKDYLRKISNSSTWLLRIINDILDFSKIESGKMKLDTVPFELHEIVLGCQSAILPTAVEKGVELNIYTEPTLGRRLIGDPTKLYQILMNLLANAVKFTPEKGTVRLTTAVTSSDADSVTVYFEIKDTGIGMQAEQLENIFLPVVQADQGNTRK